jgi:hypothetical protein
VKCEFRVVPANAGTLVVDTTRINLHRWSWVPAQGRDDENQYFSSFDPASAPIAVTSAVEIVYQVATNSGESSVQCEA